MATSVVLKELLASRVEPWKRAQKRKYHVRAVPGFHMNRMAATEKPNVAPAVTPSDLQIRFAENDGELYASAWLRARSFYQYQEERKFAGVLHQTMKAQEEFEHLKAQFLMETLGQSKDCSKCIIATAPLELLSSQSSFKDEDLKDQVLSKNSRESAVVGTLDVVAATAVDGEFLIGNAMRPAYLANVCVSNVARRCGVGELMVESARDLVRTLDGDALFVHILAANMVGQRFYKHCGFVVDKEESSNQATMRGHCLDGIQGGGRTMLLKDSKLWKV